VLAGDSGLGAALRVVDDWRQLVGLAGQGVAAGLRVGRGLVAGHAIAL
jgi:hypothetical protein